MLEIQGQQFEWDRDKNLSNIEKHGIPFKDAATAFFDPNAVLIDDIGHSLQEDRFVILGFSKNHQLLMVCHCYRSGDDVIRIFSARKATKAEQKYYGGGC
jgi:uncharacterized DUF497 family protein